MRHFRFLSDHVEWSSVVERALRVPIKRTEIAALSDEYAALVADGRANE